MSKHFTLSIKLGNDAMRTGLDVAEALHGVADHVQQNDTAGIIWDANGNRVGEFSYFEQAEDDE